VGSSLNLAYEDAQWRAALSAALHIAKDAGSPGLPSFHKPDACLRANALCNATAAHETYSLCDRPAIVRAGRGPLAPLKTNIRFARAPCARRDIALGLEGRQAPHQAVPTRLLSGPLTTQSQWPSGRFSVAFAVERLSFVMQHTSCCDGPGLLRFQ
jgi:hypothetical protein